MEKETVQRRPLIDKKKVMLALNISFCMEIPKPVNERKNGENYELKIDMQK